MSPNTPSDRQTLRLTPRRRGRYVEIIHTLDRSHTRSAALVDVGALRNQAKICVRILELFFAGALLMDEARRPPPHPRSTPHLVILPCIRFRFVFVCSHRFRTASCSRRWLT